ncbi:biotin carboxyl carrier protein of acetyl-CoA carboxylase 1, chloroplastic-like [Olea europaea var. sylvestris]|uniref:Biotin carboxyl carrier protein of acetyl-CoA carboxylase n=1 Tax=Olea europaea subsp. europaea TaxID=158383 RepID=A0A8S0QKI8_OLEEU|nr:biotin carboxyl carrier protein of acetyl-CoA carboxylase 1, chloroplastic-like [Olea europaea var. sylvestris]CAA2968135.1 biotin carboxyl carrier of acetyl- carboxylase, chloroplastic-like [Olea europaea subsp. europaea]
MASSFRPATAACVTENRQKSNYSPVCRCHLFHGSRPNKVSFRLSSKPKLRFSSKGLQSDWKCFCLVRAKLNEVAVNGNSNAAASTPAKAEVSPEAKDANPSTDPPALASEESISEFITQVASLVKLVDSKDIVELQTKQLDCELYICKKEALPPPPTSATMMQSHSQSAVLPSLPAPSPAPIPASSPAPTPGRSAPEVKKSSSFLSPLKCPMAGTFYRSPAPGEPPFMKVGDKVQKGQVVCIIEAMKLMNEIEADQSGTIVEIFVEDGKPVSVDTPLFLIEP